MIIIPKLDQIKLLDIFSFMGKIKNKIVSNDAKMDQNSSKKQNGLKKKVKTK